VLVSKHSDMDHTVLPANYTMPVFPSYAFTRWRLHWMWWRTSNCSSLLIYGPREDDRLSWPGWLTYSGQLTHIIGNPSATGPTGRVQDGKRTLARDWRSSAEPCGPPKYCTVAVYCWQVVTCRKLTARCAVFILYRTTWPAWSSSGQYYLIVQITDLVVQNFSLLTFSVNTFSSVVCMCLVC